MRDETEDLPVQVARICEMLEPAVVPGANTAAEWEALERRISGSTAVRVQRSWWKGTSIGVAAAIIIAIVGINYISNSATPPSKTYTTATGERMSVHLTDGSEIIIAPATKLKIAGRNVELQGEAVFTVNQHTGAPFIVKSGNTTTRVLGTKFGVRAYDNNVRVAVADGRVGIEGMIASAGDVVMIDDGKADITHNANITALLAWTRGQITFQNTPVSEAFQELERFYGVTFVAASPSILSRHVTGTLDNMPLETAVASLERLLNAKAGRAGNRITFKED